MTADFLKLCRRLESLPHLREVSGLPSLPKPNYVLLHESRYKQVWRSYMEVIRQQRRRQQLWIWRHQAYADMATVALMSSASRLMRDRDARKAAHRFELRLRETPLRGTFFDWTGYPPIWNMTAESAFYIGPTKSLGCLPKTSSIDLGGREGTSLATWNTTKLLASVLQIEFAAERLHDESSSDFSDRQVAITLIDFMRENQNVETSRRLVVPLALIERPDAFDDFQSEWCLS